MPNLYIIAGCNGAGKTTASFTILPEILDCKEFVNADEIARGLSPFQPEGVAIEAALPDTPRKCTAEEKTLVDLRAKVEKHIKNTYLKRVDAPVGVKPKLKCWMELNEG